MDINESTTTTTDTATGTNTIDIFAMDSSEFKNFDLSNYESQQIQEVEETNHEQSQAETEDISNTDQGYDELTTEEHISEEEREEETTVEHEDGEPTEFDYEAEYKKLIGSPIKANGKEITIKSPEEAKRLMQMGASYYKQMEAMKPHRKVIAMLEQNGMMDEAKLNYAIDLLNKNPNAISKLVSEAGDDYSYEDSSQYKPTDYSVDQNQIEVSDVLKSIKGTETYQQTIKVIGQEWDSQSREIISQHPSVIQEINNHMANGTYEQVSAEVERRKLFGTIDPNMPDIIAYKTVGDEIFGSQQIKKPSPIKPHTKSDSEIRQSKIAASSPKGSPNSKERGKTPNVMNMSAEEFAKYSSKFFR